MAPDAPTIAIVCDIDVFSLTHCFYGRAATTAAIARRDLTCLPEQEMKYLFVRFFNSTGTRDSFRLPTVVVVVSGAYAVVVDVVSEADAVVVDVVSGAGILGPQFLRLS